MFSIGELSKRTGVKIATIRYYEKSGLISLPERSSGNQRRYSSRELGQLSFIKHGRELGMSIDAIRELLHLSAHPHMACAEAHQIAKVHLKQVAERIAQLKRLQKELQRISTLPDSGVIGDCQVIRALADHSLCATTH